MNPDRDILEIDKLAKRLDVAREGRVTAVQGSILRALVPDVHVGELCRVKRIDGELDAEVIGFNRDEAILMPFDHMHGVAASAAVRPTGSATTVPAGDCLCGRVIDALGRPVDFETRGPIDEQAVRVPLIVPPPNSINRTRVTQQVETGVRAIDAFLPLGRGQRIGLFAAAGGGKSTLLSQFARNVLKSEDRVVLALIGERRREVLGFLDDLGSGLEKATVVVSTSDEPALLRLRAAHAATAIAEEARDRGQKVVLMMDSVTRFARALREVGLSVGEPVGQGGYPASVFSSLPMLFERAGNSAGGSITAIYTVLVAGDDIEEPVADETMSLLDGHIVLSRRLAKMNHYPAIEVPLSTSRLLRAIIRDKRQLDLIAYANEVLAFFAANESKIRTGLFEALDQRELSMVSDYAPLMQFLRQNEEPSSLEETWAGLERLIGAHV